MLKRTLSILVGITCCLVLRQQALAANGFPDMPSTSPYYEAMLDLQARGIVKGNPDGTLGGDHRINRGDLMVIIFRYLPGEVLASDKNCFPDVTTQYFAGPVCAGKRMNAIKGFADGLFHPEREVTAGQAAKIEVNTVLPQFFFVELQEALDFVESEGLSRNRFTIDEPITRYEAFERLLHVIKAKEDYRFVDQADSEGNLFDPEIDPIKNHLGADESVYTEWKQHAYDTFLGKEPMILFFYASWCPYCRKSDEVLLSALPELKGGVIWFKVNYDTELELKKKYGITVQDTFVILGADGEVVAKYNGLDDAAEAQSWNNEALGQ